VQYTGLRPHPLIYTSLRIMSEDIPSQTQFLHHAGAPAEVFPTLGWSISPGGDPIPPDILDQFGTIPLPSEAGMRATHMNSIWAEFQLINQEWILQSEETCPLDLAWQ